MYVTNATDMCSKIIIKSFFIENINSRHEASDLIAKFQFNFQLSCGRLYMSFSVQLKQKIFFSPGKRMLLTI